MVMAVVSAPERLVQTFEWDGMPGRIVIETIVLENLGARTNLVTVSQFHSPDERDAMLGSDAADGLNRSYAALDALLARIA